MSNVQAAIKRSVVVLAVDPLRRARRAIGGVRAGAPDAASADHGVLPLPGPSQAGRPARRGPARAHDARREDRPDGPDQRRGAPGRSGHPVGPRPAQPRPDEARSSRPTRSARSSPAAARGRPSATTAGRGPTRSTPSSVRARATAASASRSSTAPTASTATTTSSTRRWCRTRSASARPSTPASPSGSAAPPRAPCGRPASRGTSRPCSTPARPALGPLLRALRRGPGADRRAGRRDDPRPAGPRPREPDSVAATAKHFVGYSAPDSGYDRTDATIADDELQDIHLPPFQQGIDAGVATVMVNSGSVNGVPVHASHAPAHRHPARPAALQAAS